MTDDIPTKQCARCGCYRKVSEFARRIESKDGLSFWAQCCDRRHAARGQPKATGDLPDNLPGRDTACPICRTELRFDSDREGRLTQLCRCGVRYVVLRTATTDSTTGLQVLSFQSVR